MPLGPICEICLGMVRHRVPIGRTRLIRRKREKLPKWKRGMAVKPVSPSVWAQLAADRRKK